MVRIKILLSLFIFFFSFTGQTKTLIESLSLCDSTFFNQMNKNKELKKVISDSNADNIKVVKEASIDINHLQDSGVTIIKYINQYYNFENYGEYYFWGFQLKENLTDAHQKLSQYMDLKKSKELYLYNSLIKNVVKYSKC